MTRRTGPSPVTRQLVQTRDQVCVSCGEPGEQIHHRRSRSMGGTRRASANSPGNLVTLCVECHASVESNRADALDRGLLLSQSVQDPSAWPVCWRDRVVLLGDDGSVTELSDPWVAS